MRPLVTTTLSYRVVRTPKASGGSRQIYIASPEDNKFLRSYLPVLESILVESDTYSVNHAFEKNKNCALNAFKHIGCRYVLSLDLEDFFDSVHPVHVSGIIPEHIIEQCFIEGSPRQGLPTSPLIATIAFLKCDEKIVQMLGKFGIPATYTRYADDLIFSFNERRHAGQIAVIVRQTVEQYGFKINKTKTRLQDAKNGRVIITGIAVDSNGLHPTRRIKKKIRAAIHQENVGSASGLLEWSKCKLPNALYACDEKLEKILSESK